MKSPNSKNRRADKLLILGSAGGLKKFLVIFVSLSYLEHKLN
jgi:hypothetical protein